MKYTDRVCRMISDGYAVSPAAILYHAEAEWCGKCMLVQKPAHALMDRQIDFRIVPADVFAEPDFYKTELTDVLTVNGHNHKALVIPYSQFITKETAEAVQTLTQNGGRVLFIDALPDGLCTCEELPAALQSCKVIPLAKLAKELADLRTVKLSPSNNRIRAMHYVGEQEFYYLFNEGDKAYSGTIALPVASVVAMMRGMTVMRH